MKLGDTIKKLRKENGMTQNDLIEKIGISRNALINYETNKRKPNLETLQLICNALNVPIGKLLGDDIYNDMYVQRLNRSGASINLFDGKTKTFEETLNTYVKNISIMQDLKLTDTEILNIVKNTKKYIEFEIYKLKEGN